jgi:hypothetical protein
MGQVHSAKHFDNLVKPAKPQKQKNSKAKKAYGKPIAIIKKKKK